MLIHYICFVDFVSVSDGVLIRTGRLKMFAPMQKITANLHKRGLQ
ncbi:hypothetical protein NEILACOT_04908 [Neisseria lactamica ATCC 23970]|uniref:Uncharacterized protein n=1 Tax=Neisseria lactamica ATCC 23970 TaxID=546265 RepID=D0WBI2_NEILA|nr:hypothetical protein NEILACOT_04908 [Neisseria lactamica ATCC 23970]